MNLNELSDVQSHFLGRIIAIEAALNTVITASPHSGETAAAIRSDLQGVSELALYEPCRDGLMDGIQSAQAALLRGL